MNNMSKIIKEHKKVTPKCNCRKKAECLMEGSCQVNDAVYKCDVTRSLPKKSLSWTCRERMEELFLQPQEIFQ